MHWRERTTPVLVVDGRRLTVGEQLGSGAASMAQRDQGYWFGASHRVTYRKFRGNADVERFGYQRAGMTTIEIESSHQVMLSHLKEVTDLIRTAIAGS